MNAEHRSRHADANRAAGIGQDARAGAIRGTRATLRVEGRNLRLEAAGAYDLADDDGLIDVASRRRERHCIASSKFGVVKLAAKPAGGGRTDPAADGEDWARACG